MCQMKMHNEKRSRNIADLKHDFNKNGVGFGSLVIVLGLFVDVLAYLFTFGLLGG
jgi:hypothetical protein